MNWEQACADARYAERRDAICQRDGKKCGRTKGGSKQCGVWDIIVLSVRRKWTRGRGGSVSQGGGRNLRCGAVRRVGSKKSSYREPDTAVSLTRNVQSSSNFGSSDRLHGLVAYGEKKFSVAVIEVASSLAWQSALTTKWNDYVRTGFPKYVTEHRAGGMKRRTASLWGP